jgi:nucleotide-binding universal stress UspA family protein
VRVLVAIDGGEASRKAIDFIARRRDMFGTAPVLTCVFVDTPPLLRAVGALGADPGMPPIPPVDADQVIGPLLEPLRAAGYTPELLTREGDAGLEIAQIAAEGGYDLVVMGTHGRGLFKRAVLGSVASKVLASCEVPVLLAR